MQWEDIHKNIKRNIFLKYKNNHTGSNSSGCSSGSINSNSHSGSSGSYQFAIALPTSFERPSSILGTHGFHTSVPIFLWTLLNYVRLTRLYKAGEGRGNKGMFGLDTALYKRKKKRSGPIHLLYVLLYAWWVVLGDREEEERRRRRSEASDDHLFCWLRRRRDAKILRTCCPLSGTPDPGREKTATSSFLVIVFPSPPPLPEKTNSSIRAETNIIRLMRWWGWDYYTTIMCYY